MEKLKTNIKVKSIVNWFYKNRRIVTIIKLAILSLLMFFAMRYHVLTNVMLALSIIFVLTEFDFDGFYISFFLIAFRFMFRNNLTGSIPYVSIVFVVYAIYALIKYFFVKKEKLKFNWFIVGISVAYLIFLLIPFNDFIFSEYAKYVLMIAMINFIVLFRHKIELKKLIMYFVYGCVVGSFIFLITQIALPNYFTEMPYQNTAGGFKRFRGLTSDPNVYALDCLLCLIGLYYLYFRKRLNIYHYLILSLTLACFTWLTYSKAMIISLIIALILVLIFSWAKDFKKNWYKPLIFVGIIILALLVTSFVFQRDTYIVFDRFLIKFTDFVVPEEGVGDIIEDTTGSLNDITTGRWYLWKTHLTYVFSSFKNFMVGGGIGTFVGPMECHNTSIQILYETGFVGTALFMALFILILKEFGFGKWMFNRAHWINWLAIIVTFVEYCSVNHLGTTRFVYHITIFMFILFDKSYLQNQVGGVPLTENGAPMVGQTTFQKETSTLKIQQAGANNSFSIHEASAEIENELKEQKDLISVIIPVYNVENYLPRCLESVTNQTYQNVEIILIDDGSPDNSPQICDDWAKKDKRIKVIHKQNVGVSSARNIGLDTAKGKFIIFVDSDDFLSLNYVESLLKKQKQTGADLVMCGYSRFVEEDKLEPKIEKSLVEFTEKPNLYYMYADLINCAIFRTLFSSEIIKNLRFNENLAIGEDLMFFTMLFTNNQHIKIGLVDEFLYNYRLTASSAIHSKDKTAFYKNYKIIEEICPYLIENGMENYSNLLKFSFYIQYIFRYYHIKDSASLAEQYNTKENYSAYWGCRKQFKFRIMAFLARHKIIWLVKLLKKVKHI